MTNPLFAPKFNALRNAIYHSARKSFFDSLNRRLNFLVIILGAGVAGKISDRFQMRELWLEFGVVIFATAQLTCDFGYRARTHEFLQRKYHEMLADIELEESPDLRKWNSKLQTIAADEPMPMRALDALAYNAALDATTSDPAARFADRIHVPFWHRMLKNLVARNGYEYRSEKEHRPWWRRFRNWLKSS
jgi:hypothetical protein